MQTPPNPMPNTKAKLKTLIEYLKRSDPFEFNRAGIQLARQLYKYCDSSICIFGRYNSPKGRLIRSIDNFPADPARDAEQWRIGNNAYDKAADLLLDVFLGGSSNG